MLLGGFTESLLDQLAARFLGDGLPKSLLDHRTGDTPRTEARQRRAGRDLGEGTFQVRVHGRRWNGDREALAGGTRFSDDDSVGLAHGSMACVVAWWRGPANAVEIDLVRGAPNDTETSRAEAIQAKGVPHGEPACSNAKDPLG